MIRRRVLLISLVAISVIGGTFIWSQAAESNDIYASLSKNFRILGMVYQEVSRRYVDEVDPDDFLSAGIDGMLSTLDPYTTYIEKEDNEYLKILTQGRYEGVGLPLIFKNKKVTVADPPFPDTPSARAGLRAGDQIIEVNGEKTGEIGFEKTVQKIRGVAGTSVSLTVKRDGVQDLMHFNLIREVIQVENVKYTGVLDGDIGYVRLTRFSRNAGKEVARAVSDLKEKGISSLILDLRSNPGGLLEAAVEISDLFFPKNTLIVSRRGRTKDSVAEYRAKKEALFGDGRLVVLVNQSSASASEIVAGAIQDHDRGIVVGDTTFGKGLVQSVIQLSKSSALKITTAKYYTPSGRCIQKENYSSWHDQVKINKDESFETDSGREVYSGGGIVPDIAVPYEKISDLVWDLRRKSMYFNFAINYANTHALEDSSITITDELIKTFKNYLKESDYTYSHPIEKRLEKFRKEAEYKDFGETLIADISTLQTAIETSKEVMFDQSLDDIKIILQRELASAYLGSKKEVEIGLEKDKTVKKAIEALRSQSEYESLLVQTDN